MSFLVTAAEGAEHTRELPIHPYVVGVIAFVILLTLLLGTLSFGKGREHT